MKLNDAKAVLGAFTLIAVTGAAQAGMVSSIVLDDFDNDPNDDAGGPGVYSTVIFNNPFGQSADFTLDTALDSGSDIGAVIFNSGIGVEQGAAIAYNNNSDGLNLDAVALGVTGFELDFLMVDQAFTMRVELGNQNMASIAYLEFEVAAGGAQTVLASLSDFVIEGMFDFTDVDSVDLSFNLEDGNTASLDFIASEFRAVVPSPGSAALLGLGGMVMTRRKRV